MRPDFEGDLIAANSKVMDLEAEKAYLRRSLEDALEGLLEMRPYVSEYFADKWGHDDYIKRAREALA